MKLSNDFASRVVKAQDSGMTCRVLENGGMFVPYGEFPHPQGMQIFDQLSAMKIKTAFDSLLGKLRRTIAASPVIGDLSAFSLGCPVYDGHPDDPLKKAEYPDKTAYGWITGVRLDDGGCTFLTDWGPDGLDIIRKKAKLFYSAYWSLEPVMDRRGCYRPNALISVGLTNRPNIPVPPMSNDIGQTFEQKLLAAFSNQAADNSSNADDAEIDASNDFLTNMMAAFSNDGNLDAVALSKPVGSRRIIMKPLHEILGLDPSATPDKIHTRIAKMANDMDEMSNNYGTLKGAHADLAGKYKGLEMASNARKMAVEAHGKNLKDTVGMLARHAQDACNSSPADLPAHLQKILGMSGYMSNAADMIGGLASDAPHGEMATTYYPSPAPLTAGSPSNTEEFTAALAMANARAETFKKAAISSRLDVLISEKKLVPSVKDSELVKLVAMSNDADVESAFVEFGKRPVLDDATLKGGGHVDTKTAAAANVQISNTDGEIIRQRESLIGKIEKDEDVSYELATTLARRRSPALFGIGTQTS